MKVFTSRPVARALNVAALAGACSALALSAGAPTALADCQKCEAPDAAALQHFLPAGPFAILPLTGNRSSIVWTEDAAESEAIMAMSASGTIGM